MLVQETPGGFLSNNSRESITLCSPVCDVLLMSTVAFQKKTIYFFSKSKQQQQTAASQLSSRKKKKSVGSPYLNSRWSRSPWTRVDPLSSYINFHSLAYICTTSHTEDSCLFLQRLQLPEKAKLASPLPSPPLATSFSFSLTAAPPQHHARFSLPDL